MKLRGENIRSIAFLVLLAAATLCTGCAGGRGWLELGEDERVATRALSPDEAESLASKAWPVEPGVYRVRYSGLYTCRGIKLPFAALAELDTKANTFRLVGLSDAGLSFFDVEGGLAEGETSEEVRLEIKSMAMGLERLPDLGGIVGRGAARIFLGPLPRGGDTLEVSPELYLFKRGGAESKAEFALTGDGRLLGKRFKTFEGNGDSWRVRFHGHGEDIAAPFPAGASYWEEARSATVEVRVKRVRKVEEAR